MAEPAPLTYAVHICADVLHSPRHRSWPRLGSARDTLSRLVRGCSRVGIAEQRLLIGQAATRAAVVDALVQVTGTLARDGLLVVTFTGHTERGAGEVDTARWCLADGGLTVSQIARCLALLPRAAAAVVIADTCYAAAIAAAWSGPQHVLVVAGCADDQTMLERETSELAIRLEQFLDAAPTLDGLRAHLAHDTPDCERPCVWTDADPWWSARLNPRPELPRP